VTKGWTMKSATEKDQVIESLREKCREFSRLVSGHRDVCVQITDVSTYIKLSSLCMLVAGWKEDD